MGVGVCPSGRMLSDVRRNTSNFKLSNPAECESPTKVKVCQPLKKTADGGRCRVGSKTGKTAEVQRQGRRKANGKIDVRKATRGFRENETQEAA